MAQRSKETLPQVSVPTYPARLYTTTEGRQFFPDILQDAFGEKGVTGFHRYGRLMGAVIPLEAITLLAGGEVDEETRIRLQNAAHNLLIGSGHLR
jgi:hypothetical protein